MPTYKIIEDKDDVVKYIRVVEMDRHDQVTQFENDICTLYCGFLLGLICCI